MNGPNFIVRLVIAASLLIVLSEVAEEAYSAKTSNVVDHASAAQARFSAPNGVDVDKQLAKSASVADIDLSHRRSATTGEQPNLNDPYISKQWALKRIQAPTLWQGTTGYRDVIVAILDTGIDQNHEDLKGRVVAKVNFTDSPTPDDIHGHGTHIAGIVAATSNNSIGIAGLAPESRLMNVKVADDKGRCQAAVVARGIIWAVDNGASVINISLELKEPSSELRDAVNYAWSRGAVIVAAAGNDGNELPIYPAYYENSIAVAATRENDKLAPLSNHGGWVDVAAPGFNIYSTLPDDDYGYASGTSFATAYVSGLAAALFSVVADTNGDGKLNDEVRAAIEAGCQEIDASGVGKGRIDATNSLSSYLTVAYSPYPVTQARFSARSTSTNISPPAPSIPSEEEGISFLSLNVRCQK